jgi:hypothetical protein
MHDIIAVKGKCLAVRYVNALVALKLLGLILNHVRQDHIISVKKADILAASLSYPRVSGSR